MRQVSGDAKRRAIEAVKQFDQRHELAKRQYRAVIGNGAGEAAVSGRDMFYWVRLLGQQNLLAQAKCEMFIPSYGQHVIVAESTHAGQRYYIVVGRPDEQGWFPGYGSPVGPHHESHEVGGNDMVTVGKYLLESLRALPTTPPSLSVFVTYDESLMFGRTVVSFPDVEGETGKTTDELVPPTYGFQWALISVDEDTDLNIAYGDAALTPTKPACPESEIPVCWIYLSPGQTEITTASIYDARPIFATGIVGDTGPTGPTGPTGDAGDAGHIHVFNEDKTREGTGSKTTFVLAQEYEPESVMVFKGGLLLRPGVDYTEVAQDTIELAVALPNYIFDPTALLFSYLAAHDDLGGVE